MNDEPLAYFITWTSYGTHLQGESNGWWKHGEGPKQPESELAHWRSKKLVHSVISLNGEQRDHVTEEIRRLCNYRGWKLWACNVRSNHVHTVIHARGFLGSKVRDQLKANSTRVLRERWKECLGRPIWTEGGDWKCINEEDDLERVIQYVAEAQDRKDRDIC